MVHIPFRVPSSSSATELRGELLGLNRCHTDQDLFNLSIAAQINNEKEWLSGVIESDLASTLSWRRKRGRLLRGFTANNILPVDDAWPDGQAVTDDESLRGISARFRYREACAYYWWRSYWTAANVTEAYAAWIMFLRSADRRAWIWMSDPGQTTNDDSSLYRLKTNHFRLNRSALSRSMEKWEKRLNKQFLGREIVAGIGPWIGNPA